MADFKLGTFQLKIIKNTAEKQRRRRQNVVVVVVVVVVAHPFGRLRGAFEEMFEGRLLGVVEARAGPLGAFAAAGGRVVAGSV